MNDEQTTWLEIQAWAGRVLMVLEAIVVIYLLFWPV